MKKVSLFEGPSYDQYSSLKQQLEQENAALLRERSRIEYQSEANREFPSQNTIVEKNDASIQDDPSQQHSDAPEFEEQAYFRPRSSQPVRQNHEKHMKRQQVRSSQPIKEEVFEMIETIERKALIEIERLRADKIDLLRRLNKEMRGHNKLKQKYGDKIRKEENKMESMPGSNKNIGANVPFAIEEEDSEELENSNRRVHHGEPEPPQFHSTEVIKNSQQRKQQYDQRGQQSNTGNVQNGQNPYHQNKSSHSAGPHPGNQNLEKQFKKLKQENMELKQNLSNLQNQENQGPTASKRRLRTELNQLYAKAKHFEQLIARQSIKKNSGIEGTQGETLLLQSNHLSEEGKKLMRVRSNPQFINPNVAPMARQYPKPMSSQFTPSPYSEMPPMENERGRVSKIKRFGSGDYEKVIDNMRRAAHY